MLQKVRTTIGGLLGPIARRWTAKSPRVIMYHRFGTQSSAIRAEDLETHLRYIRDSFNPMRLDTLLGMIKAGESPPPRTVVVTVDDGYKDFLKTAYPVLRKYEVPATVFVVSKFMRGGFWLWFDRLRYIFDHASDPDFNVMGPDGPVKLRLDCPEARYAAWDSVMTRCLRLAPEERNAYVAACEKAADVQVPESPVGEFAPLSAEDIQEMDARIVEIGSHTRTHPILSGCSDEDVIAEIAGSKTEIEAAIGRRVVTFCYPNGMSGDFDPRAERAVDQAGYLGAVTAFGGLVCKPANRLALPRMSAYRGFSSMRNELNGVTYLFEGRR
jgi:peptidoglycan/xylan/chitin deacetylase (PgdA/CDA1 family)